MTKGPAVWPQRLSDRLFTIDTPLLADRYRQALTKICGRTTKLESFRVDAAGFSPDIAAELSDPCYLGQGPGHPYFIVVSVDQLRADLFHPSLGFARPAFLALTHENSGPLADLTVRESIFGEISHEIDQLSGPTQAGLVRQLTVKITTPTDRIAQSVTLERMREELLTSDRRWHEEAFIARMTELAEAVNGLVPAPRGLAQHATTAMPCHIPLFGGCHVFGALPGSDSVSHVVGGDEFSHVDGVEIYPRTPQAVLSFLANHGLIEGTLVATPAVSVRLEQTLAFTAVDSLAQRGLDENFLARMSLVDLRLQVRIQFDPDPLFLELEDVRLKISTKRPVELASYSPITQLRLAQPRAVDEATAATVRHLLASMDLSDLPRVLQDAPDLFFSIYSRQPPWKQAFMDRWWDHLEEN